VISIDSFPLLKIPNLAGLVAKGTITRLKDCPVLSIPPQPPKNERTFKEANLRKLEIALWESQLRVQTTDGILIILQFLSLIIIEKRLRNEYLPACWLTFIFLVVQ
jgi:hypothetical protein